MHYLQTRGSYWLSDAAALRHQAIHVPVPSDQLVKMGDLDNIAFSVGG